MISYALLWLLRDRPDYGYALFRRLQERVGPAWKLNIGQVYQSLQSLSSSGQVREREGRQGSSSSRRVYEITEKGRDTLARWSSRSDTKDRPFRDEGLLRLFVLEDGRYDEALQYVDERRQMTAQWLDELNREREPLKGVARETAVIRDLSERAVVMRAEAYGQWLELCRESLMGLIASTQRRTATG